MAMHSDIDWFLSNPDPEQSLAEGVYLTHRAEIECDHVWCHHCGGNGERR